MLTFRNDRLWRKAAVRQDGRSPKSQERSRAFVLVRLIAAADPRYDRDRAVSQGAKLGQTARLEARRYYQCIRAGLNEMGERFVIADHNRYTAGIRLCDRLIAILEVLIPTPKQGQLHSFAQDGGEALKKEIESLLPGQPAYHAEQRGIRGWIKTKPPLQCRFVCCSRFSRVRAEARGDMRICFGVPNGNIDAVEDSA